MKKVRLFALLLALAMTSALVLSGCSKTPAGTPEPTASPSATDNGASEGKFYSGKTVIGTSTWVGYAPMYLAQEMGFFEDEGVEVEMKLIESAGDKKSALAANQIQGTCETLDTYIMSRSSGLDVVQTLMLDASTGGDGLVAKKEYNSLEDLRGATIAMATTGGASLFWFNYLCDQFGMTMDDFNIINMSAGDAGTAFVAGQVDAAMTWEPWLTNASKTDFGKVLYSSTDYPDVIVDSLGLSADYVKNYPDSVRGIVNGWYKALDYMETNPDDAYKIMAEVMGQSVEDFKGSVTAVTFYDQEGNIDYFTNKMKNMCQMASDLWIKLKLMENPVDPETCYNGSFIQ